MAQKKSDETEINVPVLKQGRTMLRIIGTTPLFQNRMAAKAMQTLLVGGRKKTAADRVQIKHDPLREYRDAAEILSGGPTALGLKVTAIKGAMCTAALETAGVTKTSAQRLLFIPGDYAPLYGTPQLRLDIVRSADISRTPDIRARPFLPQWGAEFELRYITPQFSLASVVALLCNAGVLIGVGDFRQEKGKGSFGTFRVVGHEQEDEEWTDLVTNHGRIAQETALQAPQCANQETAELMEFHTTETKRRAS